MCTLRPNPIPMPHNCGKKTVIIICKSREQALTRHTAVAVYYSLNSLLWFDLQLLHSNEFLHDFFFSVRDALTQQENIITLQSLSRIKLQRDECSG